MRDDAVLGRALPLDRGLGPPTKLINTTFWKPMNRFWCQLAQVVHGTTA